MPYFDVFCESHGNQEVQAKDSSQLSCPVVGCRREVKRMWSAPPTHRMEFRSGFDMGAGEYFNSRRDRENWIAASDSKRMRD